MVNWQVTPTTVHCEAIDDEVTIMVYRDGSTKCTSYQKYHKPTRELSRLLRKKSQELSRKMECEGTECPQAVRYRDKLFAEEAAKSRGVRGS